MHDVTEPSHPVLTSSSVQEESVTLSLAIGNEES
jgi:hypothetical protein